MDHAAAKEVEGQSAKQGSTRGDRGTAQGLVHGAVEDHRNGLFAIDFEVFADAVEDHDSVVDRVTHDGQQGGDDLEGHLLAGDGKSSHDDCHIVKEGQNGHKTKSELKAEPDVDDHQDEGDHEGQGNLTAQFASHFGPHHIDLFDHLT